MNMDLLRGRDLLDLDSLTTEEIYTILDEAQRLKEMQKKGMKHPVLEGKTLAMIFTKSSTRTRVSFEVGIQQLGGQAIFLSPADAQFGRGEIIKDTARVLARYVDGIMIRTFSHDDVIELAQYADIPVINGLTDLHHPCQVLADLQTILEHKGELHGLKMAFIGDGNNMANSLIEGCAKVGIHLTIAAPEAYRPDPTVLAKALTAAKATGSIIEVVLDPREAANGADVVYTDVWASMGQEEEAAARAKAFVGYQVNADLMKLANHDAIVLHCLPAHRGEEITDEVIEGLQSRVFDEAENRLHAQKAVMAMVM